MVEDIKELFDIIAQALEIIVLLLVIKAKVRDEIKEFKKNRKRVRRKR